MATLKVFVSSTAYDLGVLRSSLRSFIESLGFEPVLSEYSDILYDPREHTHVSCIAEVRNCDVVVLVVGSRFGGQAIPDVVDSLRGQTDNILNSNSQHKFSITQAEALTAFDQGIPVFAFVDSAVLHDYRVYSLNPNIKITYPSISQPGTAEYIFEFINFLQHRSYGNAVIPFARLEDVVDHLRKQWTALFQRLLRESRDHHEEARRIDRLSEQFEDLKTALLATVVDGEARKVARGVVRYRRLIDFVRGIPAQEDLRPYVLDFNGDWRAFLGQYGKVIRILSLPSDERSPFSYSVMIREDETAYLVRLSISGLDRISAEWNDFKTESKQLRSVVYDTLTEQEAHPIGSITRLLSKEEADQFITERTVSREEQESPGLDKISRSDSDMDPGLI